MLLLSLFLMLFEKRLANLVKTPRASSYGNTTNEKGGHEKKKIN